jgi:beta-N-acetylhexosaminidase
MAALLLAGCGAGSARITVTGNVAHRPSAAQLVAAAQAADLAAAAPLLSTLSVRQLAGQRIIYGYSGLTPPAQLLTLIRQGDVGGVIFFGSNFRSRPQFTAAVRLLEKANASTSNPARAYPLLLMTDQEGGLVRRLPGAPVRSEKAIGSIRPISAAITAARQAGGGAAQNLRSFGLNVNLAPVLDVFHTAGDFDDQFQRSYSMSASVVSALGAPFVRAQQGGKVAATAKHFPGLGRAGRGQNTDNGPVKISASKAALQSVDEAPYAGVIKAGVKLVMVSWAVYPNLGSTRPAGLSPVIVQGQLRDRLGFAGVTITDSIAAGALRAFGSTGTRALKAAQAGMDLILVASLPVGSGVDCLNALAHGYSDGVLNKTTFKTAVAQILALRKSLPT